MPAPRGCGSGSSSRAKISQPVGTLFKSPLHPYTHGLMRSIPRLDLLTGRESERVERLAEIDGIVPALSNLPPGCAFAPRCEHADKGCHDTYPPYQEHEPGHWAGCWHADKLSGDQT